MCETIKIDQLSPKFDNVYQAIETYLTKSPVRQKPQEIEQLGGSKPIADTFDASHPNRVHAAITHAFGKLESSLNKVEKCAIAFWLKRYPPDFGAEKIAYHESLGTNEVSRSIQYVKEAIEDVLIDRDLLPMPDNYRPAQRNDVPVFYKAGRPKKNK